MQNQAYVFAIFILNGVIIGILFDVFRILRKSFKTSNLITYIQDILFWILCGLILLYSIFKFNNGILRLFIFLGISVGIILYMLIFSKIFINFSVSSIKILKKILKILIIIPIKEIIKIFYKTIKYLYAKIIKILYYIKSKLKKLLHKHILHKNKKDFA